MKFLTSFTQCVFLTTANLEIKKNKTDLNQLTYQNTKFQSNERFAVDRVITLVSTDQVSVIHVHVYLPHHHFNNQN